MQRHRTAESAASPQQALDDRARFLVWASRHYLWSAVRSAPAPEFVLAAFGDAGIEWLYYALDRVLVCLLAAPACEIVVHDIRCPNVARHERALLAALDGLDRNDDDAFAAAMSAIMLPTAVKVAEPPMRLLAAGRSRINRDALPEIAGYASADDLPTRRTIM